MHYKKLLSILIILIVIIGGYLAVTNIVSYKAPAKIIKHTNAPLTHLKKTTSSNNNLSHIFLIVDENQPYPNIVGNPSAPYLNSLIKNYSSATNYHAVAHPSLPNYLALTSGSTDGITTDCNPPSAGCEVNVPNIADLVKNSGRTWKEYAETMPSTCYAYNALPYATKHNPFVYFTDIINNKTRCNKDVVPFSQLQTDLSSVSTTPNYAFITPNICNDMHSCPISTGDAWLAKTVPMILSSKAFKTQNSVLIITWDEGYATTNHVLALLVGNSVKNNYQSNTYYNHYSILHTIEAAWGLPSLTANDKQAPIMNQFFKPNIVFKNSPN